MLGRTRSWHDDPSPRPRRRLLVGIGGGLFGVVVILGAAALHDATRARAQLTEARSGLAQAMAAPSQVRTPEGRATMLAAIDRALRSIERARGRIDDSASISAVGSLPVLRSQRAGLLGLIHDSAAGARAGRALLVAAEGLAERQKVRDGTVPLDALAELRAHLLTAGQAIGRTTGSDVGLWGALGDARRRFNDLAESSSSRLTSGSEALGAAVDFLGAAGERNYFVALQNNAEMRNQGAVLSYVLIRFDAGRIAFEPGGSVGDLSLTSPVPVALPAGTEEVFGPILPTLLWQSVNATADFALSGRTMAAMYRQATGEEIDGVIAVDVPALAALLRVVGPVVVEGVPEPVNADNVGRLLLSDFYVGLDSPGDQEFRRERLGDVVGAVSDRLTKGISDLVALGGGLGDAAAGGHLRLWSRVESEEQVFERTGLGGGPASGRGSADRTFHLAVENRTATKLDYYIKPKVRYDVQITRAGAAVVRTTITIDNTAPVGAPPSYALGPDQFTERPGDYLAWVLLWGPAGSNQVEGGVDESGLKLAQRIIDVAAGQQRELSFETVIPDAVRAGEFEMRLVPQPTLEPMPLEVEVAAEGWKLGGDTSVSGSLDRTLTLRWKVSR